VRKKASIIKFSNKKCQPCRITLKKEIGLEQLLFCKVKEMSIFKYKTAYGSHIAISIWGNIGKSNDS
jgi:hypothetical protein